MPQNAESMHFGAHVLQLLGPCTTTGQEAHLLQPLQKSLTPQLKPDAAKKLNKKKIFKGISR